MNFTVEPQHYLLTSRQCHTNAFIAGLLTVIELFARLSRNWRTAEKMGSDSCKTLAELTKNWPWTAGKLPQTVTRTRRNEEAVMVPQNANVLVVFALDQQFIVCWTHVNSTQTCPFFGALYRTLRQSFGLRSRNINFILVGPSRFVPDNIRLVCRIQHHDFNSIFETAFLGPWNPERIWYSCRNVLELSAISWQIGFHLRLLLSLAGWINIT